MGTLDQLKQFIINFLDIQDEGTVLPRQNAINFIGGGVTASDDPSNNRTNVDIPGGVGGVIGSWSVIGDYIAGVQESGKEFVISPAITFSDDSYIVAVFDGTVTNSTSIVMTVNQDTSSNYFRDGSSIVGGVESIIDSNSLANWNIASGSIITGSLPFFVIIELGLTQGAVGAIPDGPRIFNRASSSAGYEHGAGFLNVEKASITHVTFNSLNFPWRVGSRITLYKVSRT